MKQLETLSVHERYKNAQIDLTLAAWDDGTVSVSWVQYVFDHSKSGTFIAPNDASRIFASVEAATEAGLCLAKQEIDLVATSGNSDGSPC